VFSERPVVVLGKWRGQKQGQIEVTGRTANGTFARTFDVTDNMTRPEHAALPQLWARNRIARLSEFNFGRDDESVREVTTLGLTYSLLTAHTSFIAVLEEVRNPGGQGPTWISRCPCPMASRIWRWGQYGSGAEPGVWALLFAATCSR
jgi:Ca-activated chloride channel family protein